MPLPVDTALAPIEAEPVGVLPEGDGWQYEPKWDGFRCLAYRDGDTIELRSKSGQLLNRYFPDMVAAMAGLRWKRIALDGELVIPVDGRLSFEELQLRLHPAESRVRKLAEAHPVRYLLFDLLVSKTGRSRMAAPLARRRAELERTFGVGGNDTVTLSPATRSAAVARGWLGQFGTGMDGIVAKRLDLPYRAGERDGAVKYKPQRTADCVVGGFRYGRDSKLVGSLLLGLYDEHGALHHVGFAASFRAAEKPALTRRLEPLVGLPGFTGRRPGGPSRWRGGRSAEWQPLRPELVVEVRYDQVGDDRFRHGTKLLRWRPDKAPHQCTLDQIRPRSIAATRFA